MDAPLTEADLKAARQYIRAWCGWACGGLKVGSTRAKDDAVYIGNTEGRDGPGPEERKHYSSCGDLPQQLVFHMGVRKPFVNRKAYQGWRSGRMLLDFYARDAHRPDHRPPASTPTLGYLPEPGDIGFIWTPGKNDAHTFVFGETLGKGTIETFNYGAGGMSPAITPGAHTAASKLSTHDGHLWVGSRALHYVLTVPALLALVEPGMLPNMAGEVVDGLEGEP